MTRYLLKRIVYFIFTLFVISLIAFAVTVSAPGDPVDRLLTGVQPGQDMGMPSAVTEAQRAKLRHELGLDLPLFYFSLQSAAEPDTLYKIFPASDRRTLKQLIAKFGDWNRVNNYYQSLRNFQYRISENNKKYLLITYKSSQWEMARRQKSNNLLTTCAYLRASADSEFINTYLKILHAGVRSDSTFQELIAPLDAVRENYSFLATSEISISSYLPVIRYYRQNQFHRWLFGDGHFSKGMLRGDFGVSYISGQPVGSFIFDRLPWTVCLSLLSILLAYAVSIPLATRMSKLPGGSLDRGLSAFLYLLYSMPGFWLATLLLMVFSNPDVLHIFPASGVKPVTGYPEGTNIIQRAMISLPYLVLPTICYSYAFVAVLTRLLRVSLQDTFAKDYIRTARAKGLGEKAVRMRHALPNALLPAITLFAEVFPLAIGGSIIIESIFTIPGMGSGVYQSIQNQDYPVLVCIFTLTGLLTMIGYLVTDIAYAFLDPRIRYGR